MLDVSKMERFRGIFSAFFSGVIFALGLVISGMTNPENVQRFLRPFADFRPELVLVMASGSAVFSLFYWLSRRGMARATPIKPRHSLHFFEPSSSLIDRPLLVGAALFGLGWGLIGYCPGPAWVALGAGSHDMLYFIPAMFLGMLGAKKLASPAREISSKMLESKAECPPSQQIEKKSLASI